MCSRAPPGPAFSPTSAPPLGDHISPHLPMALNSICLLLSPDVSLHPKHLPDSLAASLMSLVVCLQSSQAERDPHRTLSCSPSLLPPSASPSQRRASPAVQSNPLVSILGPFPPLPTSRTHSFSESCRSRITPLRPGSIFTTITQPTSSWNVVEHPDSAASSALTSCVALDRLLNLSGPQLPHM